MEYIMIRPNEKLYPYIKYFWILENNDSIKDLNFKAYPDGYPGLICLDTGTTSIWEQNDLPTNFIFGQQEVRAEFISENFTGLLGVSFNPQGLHYLSGIPANYLTQQAYDLQTLFSLEGKQLNEQLVQVGKHEKIKLLEKFFLRRLKNFLTCKENPYIHHALQMISSSSGLTSVTQICKRIGYSERYLFKHFQSIVGLTPKSFCKISRLQRAMRLMEMRNFNLTEITHSCGYYDQAHFIKDFKSYAFDLPKEYIKNLPEVENLRF
jgi:AraC-like DNA-binding protein